MNKTEEYVETQVKALIIDWQQDLPNIQVILGGSIISGLLIVDEQTRTIDADIRFLTNQPTDITILQNIERVTGLLYRKTITVNDWPDGMSTGIMVEGLIHLTMLPFPLEVEGCIRNKKYVGWHQYFQSVLSLEELATIRSQKRELRHDKVKYKQMKLDVVNEVKRRCLARGLVTA